MMGKAWLLWAATLIAGVFGEIRGEEDIAAAVRSLREQVTALLEHRQQDYNALEGSLKRAIEENTELFVLKNEVKQLRKEVNALRGGNGNEQKNERLRVRWLGSAVTELRGEVAEVLRTRNASEELAERTRTRGELALLKGDVASLGRGIRNLGGRMAKIEAVLATVRLDVAAVKERFGQLSRTSADIASQLSAVQVEAKSLKCESANAALENAMLLEWKRGESLRRRPTRRHAALESEEWPKLRKRVKAVEKIQAELARRISSASSERLASRVRALEAAEDCAAGRDGARLVKTGRAAAALVFCRAGWTVVGRRTDGTLDFDRSWTEYALGFGSPLAEHWIGNENLHQLTRDNCTSLRIDLVDVYGERWRAEYRQFLVASESTGYRVRVAGYSGNATDAFSYQNGMAFSAKDRDMDVSSGDCAGNYHGGWWFGHCQHANLNGRYSLGLTWFRSDQNQWMSIVSSEMSLRRRANCRGR